MRHPVTTFKGKDGLSSNGSAEAKAILEVWYKDKLQHISLAGKVGQHGKFWTTEVAHGAYVLPDDIPLLAHESLARSFESLREKAEEHGEPQKV